MNKMTDDAPTIEPGRVLPRGDGDARNGGSILSNDPEPNYHVCYNFIIPFDDNSSIYRGTRNYESTTGNLLQLCFRGFNRNFRGHDNKALR